MGTDSALAFRAWQKHASCRKENCKLGAANDFDIRHSRRHRSAAPTLASPSLLAYVILQTWPDGFWDLQETVCLRALGHARQRCQAGLALTWRSQQFLMLVHCGCAIVPLPSRSSSIGTGRVQQVDKRQEERTRP